MDLALRPSLQQKYDSAVGAQDEHSLPQKCSNKETNISSLPQLSQHDFRARQKHLVHESRCCPLHQWVTDSDTFQAWIESSTYWQLRLCGGPRSGKYQTTLAALIAEYLQKTLSAPGSRLIITIFLEDFLTEDSGNQGDLGQSLQDSIVCACLRQILESQSDSHILNRITTATTPTERQYMLQSTIHDAFVIVDGADSLSVGDLTQLYGLLKSFRASQARVLLTSHHKSEAAVERMECDYTETELGCVQGGVYHCPVYWQCSTCPKGYYVCRPCYNAKRRCPDDHVLAEPYDSVDFILEWDMPVLSKYITWALDTSKFWKTGFGRRAKAELGDQLPILIATKARGRLSMAKIYVERLVREQKQEVLSHVTSKLPEDETEYFDHLVPFFFARDPDEGAIAAQIVSIIAHANGSLQFAQLVDATVKSNKQKSLARNVLTRAEILRLTRGMVEVRDSVEGSLRFIHEDFRSYVREQKHAQLAAHYTCMADLCLEYLASPDFAAVAKDDQYFSYEIFRQHAFLTHAARSFGAYLREESSDLSRRQVLGLFEDSERLNAILTAAWYSDTRIPWLLPPGASAIHACAWFGMEKVMLQLLSRDPTFGLESGDPVYGNTALHLACFRGHNDVAELLLRKAPASTRNLAGQTAIHLAVMQQQIDILKLFQSDKRSSHVNTKDSKEKTPLRTLMDSDQDPEVTVKELLSVPGIDVNAVDKQGRTPLMVAMTNGFSETAMLLCGREDTDITSRDSNGRTSFHYLWEMLNEQDLTEAIWDILDGLMQLASENAIGEALNMQDAIEGSTQLMVLIRKADLFLSFSDWPHMEDILERMLGVGMRLGIKDSIGMTALHYAAKFDIAELVEWLCSKDSDVDSRDLSGQTPLFKAFAQAVQNDESTRGVAAIEVLIKHGARVDLRDIFGQTVFDIAQIYGNVNARETLEASSDQGRVSSIHHDRRSWSTKSLIFSGDLEGLKSTITNGLRPEDAVEPTEHNSPLHYAALYSNSEAMEVLLDSELIDVNHQNDEGNTALHITIASDTIVAMTQVPLLVSHGAGLELKDHYGRTAFATAIAQGLYENAAILQEKGACITEDMEGIQEYLFWGLEELAPQYIQAILDIGIDVNVRHDYRLLIQIALEKDKTNPGVFEVVRRALEAQHTRPERSHG